MINSKSTKAQLLEHISELEQTVIYLESELIASRPVTLSTVRNELAAAVNDAIRFERWCAKGFQRILDELRSMSYSKA